MSKLFVERIENACQTNYEENNFVIKVTEEVIHMYSEGKKVHEIFEIFNNIYKQTNNTLAKIWLLLVIHVLRLKTGLTIKNQEIIDDSKNKIKEIKAVMLRYLEIN